MSCCHKRQRPRFSHFILFSEIWEDQYRVQIAFIHANLLHRGCPLPLVHFTSATNPSPPFLKTNQFMRPKVPHHLESTCRCCFRSGESCPSCWYCLCSRCFVCQLCCSFLPCPRTHFHFQPRSLVWEEGGEVLDGGKGSSQAIEEDSLLSDILQNHVYIVIKAGEGACELCFYVSDASPLLKCHPRSPSSCADRSADRSDRKKCDASRQIVKA